MFVPFESLPPSSRVWVYQSSRLLSAEEQQQLISGLREFVSTWTAHQAGLKGSAQILNGVFVIVAIDEGHNHATGCSIDKSVHFMKSAGVCLGIDFFDRMTAVCQNPDGTLMFVKASAVAGLIGSGALSLQAKVFNTLISDLNALTTEWMVPIQSSWLANFLPSEKST
jgi:hypothetical protein